MRSTLASCSTILVLVAVVLNSSFMHARASEDTIEILDFWTNHAEMVWSYDIEVDARVEVYAKSENDMKLHSRYKIRQRFMQGKWRFDFLEKEQHFLDQPADRWVATPDDILAFAFNGSTIRFFNKDRQFGQVYTLGSFDRSKLPVPQLYECYHSEFYGELLPNLLSDRESSKEIDNLGMYLLSFGKTDAPHNYSESEFQVVLGEASGYLPTEIVYGSDLSNTNSTRTEIENKVERSESGLFVPTESIKRIYSLSYRGSTKAPSSITTITVDMSSAKFNLDISPEVFEVPYPPGTVVYDTITEQNYLQEDGGKVDYQRAARVIRERMSQVEFEEINKPSPKLMQWAIVVLNLSFLIFLVITIWLRKQK